MCVCVGMWVRVYVFCLLSNHMCQPRVCVVCLSSSHNMCRPYKCVVCCPIICVDLMCVSLVCCPIICVDLMCVSLVCLLSNHMCRRHVCVACLLSNHMCQPQRHCSHASHSGIPTSDHTRDLFCITALSPEINRGDVTLLVGCHLRETLHCCRVT